MWLPRFNKSPPLYDEFVGVMWRMPNLTGLYVHGIDDLPASLVDLMMHNKTLEQLGLSNVKIPQLACHLQTTSLSYRSIEANSVTGDVELLFSNSSSTLQRLEIGSQFPIRVISTLSHSPTNGMSSLVELTIWKSLTEEQARWFVRLLPCCPILGTLSIHGKLPSPMSAIPPQALPRLHSLRADEDGHALVLLGNPIRRVYALTLTLKGPSMFHLLQGVHSRPTSISGEIAHACLTTPNDDFHRLVQDCERFHNVFVSLTDFATQVRCICLENYLCLLFTGQIAPTARLLTLMPSLEHISIIFLLPSYSNFKSMAKSLKEPRAIEIIQHWLKEADQFCSLLQRLSIKVDVAGNHIWFDCVRRKQDQSKKWGVRIWREYDISTYIDSDITQRAKSWVANIEI